MSTCRACFVPMCSTGYNSSRRKNIEKGESNKSLFRTPKDTALFQKWQRAIPKTHNLLTSKNVVCELHFLKEDVLRFYETKMPDGTIDKIERGRPKLRDGAVPCIFPNLPSYYTKIPRKRKSPTRRAQIPKKTQKVSPMSESVIEIPSSVVLDGELLPTVSDINDEQLDPLENNNSGQSFFQQLKDNLSKVATPNDDWSGTFIPGTNEIVFAEWNDTYTARKRVIIKCDMSVKVLFGNTEISRDCIKKIVQDFEEVENLLKTVHHLIACRGIRTISSSDSCTGLAPARIPGQKGVLTIKCASCRLESRKNTKSKSILERCEKIKGSTRNLKRKNSRLIQKVIKLKNKIEANKKKCATKANEVLEEAIMSLPSSQQELVRTCFAAAKVDNPKNKRYTHSWMYDCLLLRIKGKAIYEHLRTQNFLPLPSKQTLNKYINRMDGCGGLQQSNFELFKNKSMVKSLEETKVDTLLTNEVTLSETLVFDQISEVDEFTILENQTVLQENEDHTLF